MSTSTSAEVKINVQSVAAVLRRAGFAEAERRQGVSFRSFTSTGFTTENVGSESNEYQSRHHHVAVAYYRHRIGWYNPTEEQRAAFIAERDAKLAEYAKALTAAGYLVITRPDGVRGICIEAWRPTGSRGADIAAESPERVIGRE